VSEGKLTVGNIEILLLTDAAGPFVPTLDHLFPDVPAKQWEEHRRRHPEAFVDEQTVHAHFGSCVLRSRGRTVLVDTGIGPQPTPLLFGDLKGRLPQELKAHGINAEDIDTVFLTHAHIDHVGWNLTEQGKPAFPNARYMLHQADWDALPQLQAAVPPYIDQTLTPLQDLGVLDLVTGESTLAEEVVALPAPGHTPGHMCVLIASDGEKAMIVGDIAVTPAQVTEPDWVFSFDSDPMMAIATRKRLLDRLEVEGMRMVQCHFPWPGHGRIVRLEGRRYFQAG
jgi:glyoxylase-like metal-dependent hydrolase (beta-lactamase superfamily II)